MIEFTTRLAAPPDAVWAHSTSLAGINAELRPWLRMDGPAGVEDLDDLVEPEEGPWLEARIRLFGLLPLDRMRITPELIDASARRFVERSELRWARRWRHDRRVRGVGEGSEVTDRVDLEPRIPGTGPGLRLFVRALFAHRHRRLEERFGTPVS